MDKSWMTEPRHSKKYIEGVDCLLDLAFNSGSNVGEEIPCPCTGCKNRLWYKREEVRAHLVCTGIMETYISWSFHGEDYRSRDTTPPIASDPSCDDLFDEQCDMYNLVRDAFGIHSFASEMNEDVEHEECSDDDVNDVDIEVESEGEGKLHTNGSKSFARKRDEMEKDKKREIGAVEFYVETHTSKSGKMSDHASKVVERCNAILWASTQDNQEISSKARIQLKDEVLQEVQGPDHPGRVRGAGKGPTPFTWRSAKRHNMSNKVERLETQLEILIKRDAERDIQLKEMERRDAERDIQVKEMERRDAEREKRDAWREIQLKKMEKMIELMYRNRNHVEDEEYGRRKRKRDSNL